MRGNNSPFMANTRKSIAIRPRLKNRFNKTTSDESSTKKKGTFVRNCLERLKRLLFKAKPKTCI